MEHDFTEDEKIIIEGVLNARKVQDFIFGDRTKQDRYFDAQFWGELFQKRVDKIAEIDITNPSAIVELRKRLLQQASLSIRALVVLNGGARLVLPPSMDENV